MDGAAILETRDRIGANFGGWFIAMGRLSLDFEAVVRASSSAYLLTLNLEVNTDDEVFVGGEVIDIGSRYLNSVRSS